MPPFTAIATPAYKDALTVQWGSSVKSDLDYMITGTIRGWVHFDGTTATVTAKAAHNVSNIIDTGVGRFTVVWTTGFSTAGYVVVGAATDKGGTVDIFGLSIITTGNVSVIITDTAATPTDTTAVTVLALGVTNP